MGSKRSAWPSSYCLSGDTEEIRKFLDEGEAIDKEGMLESFIDCCIRPLFKGKENKKEEQTERK